MSNPVHALTLLGRGGCHLCEDMRVALMARVARFSIPVHEIDITGNAELEARYGWEIPVLLAENREICRHFLDRARLNDWLSEQGFFL